LRCRLCKRGKIEESTEAIGLGRDSPYLALLCGGFTRQQGGPYCTRAGGNAGEKASAGKTCALARSVMMVFHRVDVGLGAHAVRPRRRDQSGSLQ